MTGEASTDTADLARWASPGDLTEDRLGQVLYHPRFSQTVRTLAQEMLDLAATDRALDGLFKDAGRYGAATWAIHADLSGGLTLPRLKEICIQSGLLSPGRARALLLYMVYLGYIEALPVPRRGQAATYQLTEQFRASWRAHLKSALRAIQVLEPAISVLMARFDEPRVADAFVRSNTDSLMAALDQTPPSSAFRVVFMDRHAGTQLVHTLILAAPEGEFLADDIVGFTPATAARRLGVSRVHLRRMMDHAVQEGLLTLRSDGRVRVEERGRSQIAQYYAFRIARLLDAAAATVKAPSWITA
jgi:hypothetical protein